jgi:ABC-type sugar transport system substrate-binding protein
MGAAAFISSGEFMSNKRLPRTVAGCIALAALAAPALVACGSSSSSSTAAAGASVGSTGAASSAAAAGSTLSAAVDPAYNGPDAPYFKTLPDPAVKSGYKFTVGFLTLNGGQPTLLEMQTAAQAEVQKLGGEFIAKDAAVNPVTQASQFEQLIAQKVNIIICDPVVANALGPSIAAAAKAGIPVVIIGEPPNESQPPITGTVTAVDQGFDYEAYATMKALAAKHPGISFATMGFAAPVDELIYMLQRMRYWGEHFGLKYQGEVDAQTDTPAGYTPAISGILAKYPGVRLVLTYNDESALAAATAVRASGKQVLVATPNAGQAIAQTALRAGKLDLVYDAPWAAIGTQAAIAAYDELTKQSLPLPKYINPPSYIVTPANAGQAVWVP